MKIYLLVYTLILLYIVGMSTLNTSVVYSKRCKIPQQVLSCDSCVCGVGGRGVQHRGCGNTGTLNFNFRLKEGGGGGRTRWVAVMYL